jgi:hypothetical protein
MVTRAALDLPCPITPPKATFAPGSAGAITSPRCDTPSGMPANTSATPSCSSG